MKQNGFVLVATDRLSLDMSYGVLRAHCGSGSSIGDNAIYDTMNANR